MDSAERCSSLSQLATPFHRTFNIVHDEPHMLPKPHARQPAVARVLEHRLARDVEELADVRRVAEAGALEVERWRGRLALT